MPFTNGSPESGFGGLPPAPPLLPPLATVPAPPLFAPPAVPLLAPATPELPPPPLELDCPAEAAFDVPALAPAVPVELAPAAAEAGAPLAPAFDAGLAASAPHPARPRKHQDQHRIEYERTRHIRTQYFLLGANPSAGRASTRSPLPSLRVVFIVHGVRDLSRFEARETALISAREGPHQSKIEVRASSTARSASAALLEDSAPLGRSRRPGAAGTRQERRRAASCDAGARAPQNPGFYAKNGYSRRRNRRCLWYRAARLVDRHALQRATTRQDDASRNSRFSRVVRGFA